MATQNKLISDLKGLIEHRLASSGNMWPSEDSRPFDDQRGYEEEFLNLRVVPDGSDTEEVSNRPTSASTRPRSPSPSPAPSSQVPQLSAFLPPAPSPLSMPASSFLETLPAPEDIQETPNETLTSSADAGSSRLSGASPDMN